MDLDPKLRTHIYLSLMHLTRLGGLSTSIRFSGKLLSLFQNECCVCLFTVAYYFCLLQDHFLRHLMIFGEWCGSKIVRQL